MTSTAITTLPEVLDALVTTGRTAIASLAFEVNVFDGYGDSDSGDAFLSIGVNDPRQVDYASSATVTQAWAGTGTGSAHARDEAADIHCAAYARVGDAGDVGQKLARDNLFSIVRAFGQQIAADVTLGGVAGLLWASFGDSIDFAQDEDEAGCEALLMFTVHFVSRV